MKRTLLGLALVALPSAGWADDRGYLTALLEDNLSGAGRKVVITGFAGALSSQATIAELTIADDDGVWITLRNVVLDWNRSALFSGNVSVNELSAAEIILARLPETPADAPKPEAGSFSLPELPISVDIGKLAAARISLGPEVLGQSVEGRLEASMSLVGGEGKAEILLERLDEGPEGKIALSASYSNADKELAIDLSAIEGPGGIAASKLDLPGLPSASLKIIGEGPFSDFTADVALATDGVDRLAGQVEVVAETEMITGFSADLAGDLAPLFLPEYAAFFGNSVILRAKGQSHQDGRLELSDFAVKAKALDLVGQLSLDGNRAPRAFHLTGRIAHEDGAVVLLPLATDLPVRVQAVDLDLSYDRGQGDGWTGRAQVAGLDRDDFRASQLGLSGSGRIAPGLFGGSLRFNAEGLAPSDAALAQALGTVLSGEAVFFWREESGALSLPKLVLNGEDYAARISGATVQGLAEGFELAGKISAELADLSRISGLVGQPLSGAANLQLSGKAVPLTGAFDLGLVAQGTDMAMGIPEVDGLLRGAATLTASALRDANGTTLRSLTVTANNLTAEASGQIASAGSDLKAKLDLSDLRVLGRGYGGSLKGDAQLTGTLTSGKISLAATGRGLRVGQTEADRILAGESQVNAEFALRDGSVQITRAELRNPQLAATASGQVGGSQDALDISARLANLGILLPEFPGPMTIRGEIAQSVAGARVDLAGEGPGGIAATLKGSVAPGFDRADLAIKGRAQAALANAFIGPRALSGEVGFDLRLNGPVALRSLTGRLSLNRGRLADPSLPFAFEDIVAGAALSGGQAKVDLSLPVSSGGSLAVSGTIGLAEPYSAALGVGIQSVTLRDPDLYETTLGGNLTIAGPLAGGARIEGNIVLDQTELRVPSTGFGGAGGLPDLRHAREPGDVRATRARAGLLAEAAKAGRSAGVSYGLDVTISAPKRVFIRGRGLDAELGGELRLLGSTANVQPAGAFNLIRGRLDILGKRLELSEALLQMEGELVPFVRILASTENDGITSSVLIEGPANDPKVSFTSAPELPEEEVLAMLLFGQGLQNLSPLQALQLANAVATLAGRGGVGMVSRLRQGFGLDNLDVKTTAEGGTQVTAGKYLTEKVYSEITVDQDGKSQVHLNLDVTDSITLRGRVSSDGETGVGVFLEKDY